MNLLKYPGDKDKVDQILAKNTFNFQDDRTKIVEEIINDVRINGDKAVKKYTEKLR